jgi:phosphoenolpyruvate carboxykinase (ATP)
VQDIDPYRDKLIFDTTSLEKASSTPDGAIVVYTQNYTGRAPKAKFIVQDDHTSSTVDWKNNQCCSPEEFEEYYDDFMDHVTTTSHYTQELYAGADEAYQIKLEIHTSTAWQALFANNMFIRDRHAPQPPLKSWKLYSFPEFQEEASVLINFDKEMILIAGTWYAGEIKKSVFTVLNHLLPSDEVLPMHCSVNVDSAGNNPAIFFGLSGTGKTTLSADTARRLVGDDEHGWSNSGLFNFEGGCYAKVIKLSHENEPEIWDAVQKRGAILENVKLLADHTPDFEDATITENTRGSYPLYHIPHVVESGTCGHPQNVIFLTCDAFGVLPPVSKLGPEEAIEQFMMGYTAKVAGTEAGVTEPVATFSHCFGAPFMPRPLPVYARLLKQKIEEHGVNCWLVNTGWSGGGYGIGERMPIEVSRAVVRAILSGELAKSSFVRHQATQLSIPQITSDVRLNQYLVPERTWGDLQEYEISAADLMYMWSSQMKKLGL